MPRTKGSDDLFRLIHSLSAEEKGYFKKFAKRHTAKGNKLLSLFNAVNLQTKFEETSLKKKFRDYAVYKVNLKEMVTDSLLLYYRNAHDHIQLFNQAQKIHILLIKGFKQEAAKMIAKALANSRKMELFSIERYLMRMQVELDYSRTESVDDIKNLKQQYHTLLNKNAANEADLSAWESTSMDWLIRIREKDRFKKLKIQKAEMDNISAGSATSIRSNLLKLQVLYFACLLQDSWKEKVQITEKQVQLSRRFKREGDSSFSNINMLNNHILSLFEANKFKEGIKLADELLAAEKANQFHYQSAFVRSTQLKLAALFHLGEFNEGLELISTVDKEMQLYLRLGNDHIKQRVYYSDKLLFLFAGKRFRECWLAMHENNSALLNKGYVTNAPDFTMLQLMTQYELGNYDIMKRMAEKLEKKLAADKMNSTTYRLLIKFFKQASVLNHKKLALEILNDLKEYYSKNKLFHRKAFGKLKYSYWLEEVSGGKTIKQCLKEWLAAG